MKLSWIAMSMFVITVSVPCACRAGEGSDSAKRTERSATTTAPAKTSPSLKDRNPRYRLREGDSFHLHFDYSPEFDQDIVVQPDGYISLEGAASVYAQGQNIPQLTETIRAAYEKILHSPVISIALKDFEKPYFVAAGQVGKPGKYDLRSDTTVSEAVAVAGGFTDSSKHSQVVVFHHISDGLVESHVLNVKKMLGTRDMAEDIHLQPGDVVYVPQNTISKLKRFMSAPSMSMYLSPTQF